jgi:hypothetical protein
MAITFPVSPVEPTRTRLPQRESVPPQLLGHWDEAAGAMIAAPVEAWGSNAPLRVTAHIHGLVETIATAFAEHYPLVLTPDAVWLAIAQGFAVHINENAERLRRKLVRHQGKVEITIRRDDFVKGSPQNPWPEAFGAFSEGIAAHTGKLRHLVVCDFSTTGHLERAASEVVLMNAVRKFVDFRMLTMCGIPEITLEGTVDDWRSIRHRVQALGEYELGFWVDALLPIADRLVASAEGQVDTGFWRSLLKVNDASGGPYLTGWINVFFPYQDGYKCIQPNRWVTDWAEGQAAQFGGGISQSTVLQGLSVAPFMWEYLGSRFPMNLLGGFLGIAQVEGSLALRPAIGWAVRDASP